MSTCLTLHTRHPLGDTISQFMFETSLEIGEDSLVEMRESMFETGDDRVEESRVTVSFSNFVILDCRGRNTGFGLTVSAPNEITNPENSN